MMNHAIIEGPCTHCIYVFSKNQGVYSITIECTLRNMPYTIPND